MTLTDHRPTIAGAIPTEQSPDGSHFPAGQRSSDTHGMAACGDPNSPETSTIPIPISSASPVFNLHQPSQSRRGTQNATAGLVDPLLVLLADVLDDMERTRIANENRLRALTSAEHGLTDADPRVATLAGMVGTLAQLEHQATLELQRAVRKHPLGPWIKQTVGIGEKQGARLLAAIGDPYWNDLHDRPRLVSELWSYCGLGDAAVQKRRKGVKSNWSTTAKTRSYLIAESCIKQRNSPYRAVYDTGRVRYSDPAVSLGHQHNKAMRLVMKEILKDLWRASRALHETPE